MIFEFTECSCIAHHRISPSIMMTIYFHSFMNLCVREMQHNRRIKSHKWNDSTVWMVLRRKMNDHIYFNQAAHRLVRATQWLTVIVSCCGERGVRQQRNLQLVVRVPSFSATIWSVSVILYGSAVYASVYLSSWIYDVICVMMMAPAHMQRCVATNK